MTSELSHLSQGLGDCETLFAFASPLLDRLQEALGLDRAFFLRADDDHVTLVAVSGLSEGSTPECTFAVTHPEPDWLLMPTDTQGQEDRLYEQLCALVSLDGLTKRFTMPIVMRGVTLAVIVGFMKDSTVLSDEQLSQLWTQGMSWGKRLSALKAEGHEASPSGSEDSVWTGLPCSPGLAQGVMVLHVPGAELADIPMRTTTDTEQELSQLEQASKALRAEVQQWGAAASEHIGQAQLALFDVYDQLLSSAGLLQELKQVIVEQTLWVQSALKQVISHYIERFESMSDPVLRSRAIDLRDIGQRLLYHLQQGPGSGAHFPSDTILVGEEVPPSALLEVPHGQLKGVFSVRGSRFSHTAILARALGVPCVVGLSDRQLPDVAEQCVLCLDGYAGQIHWQASERTQAEWTMRLAHEAKSAERYASLQGEAAQTADGYQFKMMVNIGLSADAQMALRVGSDGVGLLRTEMLFLSQSYLPGIREQKELIAGVLRGFAPQPVYVRILDVGGDKPLPYFQHAEPNPYLGLRGIRFGLDHMDILNVQLRALIELAQSHPPLHVMLPMVSHVHEIHRVKRYMKQHLAHWQALHPGQTPRMPPLGVMVEVPALLFQMDTVVKHVDFISIGSNDLVQYLLAVDRNNYRVAHLYHHLHPTVLHAIRQVIQVAHAHHVPVSLCGEMASDPAACFLLLAMGVDALSVAPAVVQRLKWMMRQLSIRQARETLEQAMVLTEAHEVYQLVMGVFQANDMGSLLGEAPEITEAWGEEVDGVNTVVVS